MCCEGTARGLRDDGVGLRIWGSQSRIVDACGFPLEGSGVGRVIHSQPLPPSRISGFQVQLCFQVGLEPQSAIPENKSPCFCCVPQRHVTTRGFSLIVVEMFRFNPVRYQCKLPTLRRHARGGLGSRGTPHPLTLKPQSKP